MTSRLAFILTIILAVGSAEAAMPGTPGVKWTALVVAGTGLAVEMPGTPVKGDDLSIGGLRSVAYRVESGETRTYAVRAEQMPSDELSLEGADSVFNEIRDGLIADGTLRAEWSLPERGGVTGRSVLIDSAVKTGSDAYTAVAHIYLRADWLYVLVATVPRGGENDPLARRFLSSARFAAK
jgi:hypothetical protein